VYHRMEMIRRAVHDAADANHRREVSDLEIRRAGPSYTYDTLRALHAEGLTPVQLVFITGTDAFAEIETWHRYPDVLDAAHFAVIARPGTTLATLQQRLPSLAARMIGPDRFASADRPAIVLIDDDTPSVSSTDIRRRAGAGDSLAGLVPPSVAAYIAQNRLYRTAPDASVAPVAPVAPGLKR
jgi:nicotinate-nucleotide adenylyltransferase